MFMSIFARPHYYATIWLLSLVVSLFTGNVVNLLLVTPALILPTCWSIGVAYAVGHDLHGKGHLLTGLIISANLLMPCVTFFSLMLRYNGQLFAMVLAFATGLSMVALEYLVLALYGRIKNRSPFV
jgi:hypothetical protein